MAHNMCIQQYMSILPCVFKACTLDLHQMYCDLPVYQLKNKKILIIRFLYPVDTVIIIGMMLVLPVVCVVDERRLGTILQQPDHRWPSPAFLCKSDNAGVWTATVNVHWGHNESMERG